MNNCTKSCFSPTGPTSVRSWELLALLALLALLFGSTFSRLGALILVRQVGERDGLGARWEQVGS